jgi:DNA-binding transcriptional MerR regulator
MNPGDETKERELTLEELSEAAAQALATLGLLDAQRDGRVQAAPDARTIRYYTTLGLLDRPRIEGRRAFYGRRHVLQLVVVKALQGAALPLAEVQARLYGRSDRELEAILDAAVAAASAARPESAAAAASRTVVWREVLVEPGLKILVEEGWTPGEDPARLEERVRAALAALAAPGTKSRSRRGSNGGSTA